MTVQWRERMSAASMPVVIVTLGRVASVVTVIIVVA